MPGTKNSGGRNAKPRSLHIRQGSFRKGRHAGRNAVELAPSVPDPPKPLEGDAKKEWGRVIACMSLSRVLSKSDGAVLYQYCQLFSETEELSEARERTTASIQILEDNLSGMAKDEMVPVFQEISKMRQLESRYAMQIRQGRMAIRQFLVEFGLTPTARTRVSSLPPHDDTQDEKRRLRYFD